jgi:hypothetical protein
LGQGERRKNAIYFTTLWWKLWCWNDQLSLPSDRRSHDLAAFWLSRFPLMSDGMCSPVFVQKGCMFLVPVEYDN